MTILSPQEIETKLKKISGWSVANNELSKEFVCSDFLSVVSFVNIIGAAAEELNHHPDIYIHSWNRIKFTLSTHSEGGITELDFILAQKIEEAGNRK